MPSFACFRWLFWRTPRTLKLLNQVRPRCFRHVRNSNDEGSRSHTRFAEWRVPIDTKRNVSKDNMSMLNRIEYYKKSTDRLDMTIAVNLYVKH